MNELHALQVRRQLLVASATLQRLRLAYEWQGLRSAASPARWAAPAIAAAATGAWFWRTAGARRSEPTPALMKLGAAALALWRLLHPST